VTIDERAMTPRTGRRASQSSDLFVQAPNPRDQAIP
jgi:hypothetical protein